MARVKISKVAKPTEQDRRRAREFAARFPSDPFAYARALKNVLRGLPEEA